MHTHDHPFDTFPDGSVRLPAPPPAVPTLADLLHARITEYTAVLTSPDPSVQRAALGALQHELRRLVRATERQGERSHFAALTQGDTYA